MCVDLRLVNSMTVSDGYPLPRVDDLVRKVSAAKFITKIDASQGYYQIPIRSSDCYKTAFSTSSGLYEFLYLPFGAKTASQTYGRIMDTLLRPHQEYGCSYIDDAPVYSDSWKEHVLHVRNVLTSVRDAGLTLKLSKCEFAKPQITFLGVN